MVVGVVSVATRLLGEVWSYSSLCGKDHHRSVEVKIHTSTSGVLQDQATFCKSVMLHVDWRCVHVAVLCAGGGRAGGKCPILQDGVAD